jgi:hypothetical protein
LLFVSVSESQISLATVQRQRRLWVFGLACSGAAVTVAPGPWHQVPLLRGSVTAGQRRGSFDACEHRSEAVGDIKGEQTAREVRAGMAGRNSDPQRSS